MYGQGNYASGPPFQQRPPPPPFQQGPPSLRPPIYQHGPPLPPPPPIQASGILPGQQYVNNFPPPPPPPSMQVHGSSQVPQYYSTGQHHSQWAQNIFQVQPEIPTTGTGNTVQPSLLGQGPPRGPVFPVGGQVQPEISTSRTGNAVQPSLMGQGLLRDPVFSVGGQVQPEIPTSRTGDSVQTSLLGQGPPRGPVFSVGRHVQHNLSLPPLEQPSKSLQPPPYNSYMYPMSQRPQFPPMVSQPPDTSASPAHEVQLSADDLGQSCSNDSRRHEKVSDPVGRVMTPNQSVDNLSAHENSLENGGATSSYLQHHSLSDADRSHSPSNSDMDMEDDFTHPAEDAPICLPNINHGFSSEPVTDSETVVEQDPVHVGPDISRDHESCSRNSFLISDSSILPKNLEPQVNSTTHQSSCTDKVFDQCSLSIDSAGKGFEKPANVNTKTCSPLNLLGGYSSDDSAENSEAHVRAAKQELAPSVPRDLTASFDTHMENNPSNDHEPKILLNSEKGFDPLVKSSGVSSDLLKFNVKSQSDIHGPDVGSAEKDLEDLIDHKSGSQNSSKVGSSLEVIRDDTRAGISQKEVLKSTSGKVDEFGRLVREDHSDNDSGDSSSYTRRRSKRGRSRSRSRSPIRGRSRSRSRSPHGRRRRSPWRRRGRHGRSRSTSPKRRRGRSKSRSRSKSPSYRYGGEIGNEKTRRHKAQLPECLDHNRGKCYRGSSCRYLHNKSDKSAVRLSSHMKQQSHDVLPVSKNIHGDIDPISPNGSVHEHEEHDESKNFKQEVLSAGESRGLTEELCDVPRKLPYTETHIGVPPDISNCQTQLIEGQAVAENSLQTSASVQSQLLSSIPYLNKDPLSTSYGHLLSTEQPFTSESTMPQSLLQELSSSVGSHSSNLMVGKSSPSTIQIPRDYNLIIQHSQFPPPSNASWNSLPPPPPLPFPFHNNSIRNTASGLPSAQFHQNIMPPSSELRYQPSTGIGLPGMYPQMPEPHKSLYDANRFGPRIMTVMSKPMDQIHGPPSHMHPYMHHSPYGLHPTPVDVPAHYGEPGNAINYFPPLAPILNEPLASKFSSNIATQRKDVPYCDMYGTPYSSKDASAGGLPVPAADQYDPLSDSIEPSSSSVKKLDISHKLPTGDSDVLRTSGSNQLLDMDGNSKLKGNGGGEGFLLPENDEYGETADAEVGDIEDGSTSNPQSAADISAEEDEIDHVKASGKTKKDRDSKSMKNFKIAIANFVKEVLKPSWRQGNMSKEAFKTIVKKTVDKVSVATGKHHIPKSREKIDHYINSQQRKLTKLVMGYVDKYVKA